MSNSTSRASDRDKRRQQSLRAYARRSERSSASGDTHPAGKNADSLLPFGTSADRPAPESGCHRGWSWGRNHSRRHNNNGHNGCDRNGHAGRNGTPFVWARYRSLEIIKLLAGIVLLVALSWEIITSDHVHFSPLYLWIQFLVCLVFLADFFIRWRLAEPGSRRRFFWTHLPYLLLAIPWLNLVDWCGVTPTHDWGLLVGLIPMLRAYLAMGIIVEWFVRRHDRLGYLFWAYIFTVALFTYLSALVFYDYEAGVNPRLAGFGNALWWAWMNVTTVGAELFAVTGVGKIVTVLLPSLGMMFFPIFTTYILDRYTGKRTEA